MATSTVKKIGFLGLTSMVFGSIVGGGIFDIPQNMAAQSALGPVLIAWLITAIGMFALAWTFKILSDERPDLAIGIFAYARQGFGRYIGFNSAWGYWLACIAGNVAFAIMVNDSLGHYFPIFLKHSWPTFVLGLAFIWFYNFLVLAGIKQAAAINTITVIIKFIALIGIILAMIVVMHIDWFHVDFWGKQLHLGPIWEQIKAPMLVTLWCFIGIEGAVVISNHAQNPKQIGPATVVGFLIALGLYVVLSILPYGVMAQPQLAKLTDPSTGYILQTLVGNWFVDFVTISVLISVGGAWVAWTILMAQLPFAAAKGGTLPKVFSTENGKGVPAGSLWISSIVMSIFMGVALLAKNVYLASINITSVIILPCYLLSAMYLWQQAQQKKLYVNNAKQRRIALFTGILATFYCFWLLYSANLAYLLAATPIYAVGIIPFWMAGHEEGKKFKEIFTKVDAILALIMIGLAILSIYLLYAGIIVL